MCILVCMNYWFSIGIFLCFRAAPPYLFFVLRHPVHIIEVLSLPQLKRITKIFIQSFQPYQILNQQQIDTYLLFFILWKHEDSLAHTHLGFYRWMQSMYKSSISWIRPNLHFYRWSLYLFLFWEMYVHKLIYGNYRSLRCGNYIYCRLCVQHFLNKLNLSRGNARAFS